MKLNLGCCDNHLEGYINVDRCPPADQIVDLAGPWPWPDNSIEYILAQDVIEHLPDKIHTMNSIWRVLEPGGTVWIEVPTTDGPGAWQDPTHCSYWNRNSFWYYTVGNPHYERFHKHYGIAGGFNVVGETMTWVDGIPKLSILLEAVK